VGLRRPLGGPAGSGAFRKVQVGRESVLVVRGRDRQLRAFLNVCRHRGAQICTEDAGSVRRALQCPYHAWTYDLSGTLVAAPNLTKMPDVDRDRYGLLPVHLREWLGYVWVCLADEPPSFEDDVMGAVVERLGDVEAIERYELDALSVGRRITYDVQANWKLIIENFMECYHCATIHPELTEVLRSSPTATRRSTTSGTARSSARTSRASPSTAARASTGSRVSPRTRTAATTPSPSSRRSSSTWSRPRHLPPHVPVAADRTVVECDWLYSHEVVASGRDVSRSVELFHRVNEQDFAACERTQPAMSSRAYEGGVLVPSEHHIGAFHDWVTQRLAG
jgi:Rieske 2Fe-2S family protein